MENSSAPLAGEYIKKKVDTPMHSSNEIKNESSSDIEDSGNFTPYDPNKPPKPKKSKKNLLSY